MCLISYNRRCLPRYEVDFYTFFFFFFFFSFLKNVIYCELNEKFGWCWYNVYSRWYNRASMNEEYNTKKSKLKRTVTLEGRIKIDLVNNRVWTRVTTSRPRLRCFITLKLIWRSKNIHLSIEKRKLFDTNVQSVLLYGCSEVWRHTKEQEHKLHILFNN